MPGVLLHLYDTTQFLHAVNISVYACYRNESRYSYRIHCDGEKKQPNFTNVMNHAKRLRSSLLLSTGGGDGDDDDQNNDTDDDDDAEL